MSKAKAFSPGPRGSRCARWLGLDHNPLRRTTDRVQAAVRLAVLVLLVTAVPLAGIVAGRAVAHVAGQQSRAAQAADHQISAVLTQAAPADGIVYPHTAVHVAWTPARWTAPDGAARSGKILAPAGAPKGSRVQVWTDASGTLTDPPAGDGVVAGLVVISVALTSLAVIYVLVGIQALVRRVLDRRRMKAWDAEWRAIGPLWNGHRI